MLRPFGFLLLGAAGCLLPTFTEEPGQGGGGHGAGATSTGGAGGAVDLCGGGTTPWDSGCGPDCYVAPGVEGYGRLEHAFLRDGSVLGVGRFRGNLDLGTFDGVEHHLTESEAADSVFVAKVATDNEEGQVEWARSFQGAGGELSVTAAYPTETGLTLFMDGPVSAPPGFTPTAAVVQLHATGETAQTVVFGPSEGEDAVSLAGLALSANGAIIAVNSRKDVDFASQVNGEWTSSGALPRSGTEMATPMFVRANVGHAWDTPANATPTFARFLFSGNQSFYVWGEYDDPSAPFPNFAGPGSVPLGPPVCSEPPCKGKQIFLARVGVDTPWSTLEKLSIGGGHRHEDLLAVARLEGGFIIAGRSSQTPESRTDEFIGPADFGSSVGYFVARFNDDLSLQWIDRLSVEPEANADPSKPLEIRLDAADGVVLVSVVDGDERLSKIDVFASETSEGIDSGWTPKEGPRSHALSLNAANGTVTSGLSFGAGCADESLALRAFGRLAPQGKPLLFGSVRSGLGPNESALFDGLKDRPDGPERPLLMWDDGGALFGP